MKRATWSVLFFVALLGFVAFGCTQAPQPAPTAAKPAAPAAPAATAAAPAAPAAPAPTAAAAAPSKGKYGGTVVMGTSGEPPHLNPVNNLLMTHYISGQLYPALLEYDFDMKPKPSLAKSWTISPDGMTYTFKLVDNAKWTDGKPLTSADVKYSFEEITIPKHPSGKTNFDVVKSIDTPDPTTVVFTLKSPFTPLISTLGHMMAPILPKHVYQGTDILQNPNNFEPKVTAGPFKFQEWKKADHITLVKNENYFKPGLPYLDRFIVRFIPDASARALALEKGEIDYLPSGSGSTPENQVERLKKVSGLQVVTEKGHEATLGVLTWGFNLRKEPFSNLKVRQAIQYAVDKAFMVEAASYGLAAAGTGPISHRSWAYSSDVAKYAYDPDRAKRLLDEAGYPVKSDGSRFSMELAYRQDQFNQTKTAEILVNNLKAIGIAAKTKPLETAAYYPAVYEKYEFDLGAVAWLSGPDPHQIAAIYDSRNIRPIQFTNFMAYKNQEVDSLLDQGAREPDLEKRKAIYARIQKIIADDSPAIWALSTTSASAFKTSIAGLPPGPWLGSRDPLDEVYLK